MITFRTRPPVHTLCDCACLQTQEASLYSLSRLSTVGLTPGSLSLMKGGLPSAPSRARSTFRAETLP